MTQEKPPRGKPDWERSLLFLNRFTVFYLEKRTTTENNWTKKYLENCARIANWSTNESTSKTMPVQNCMDSAVQLYGICTDLSVQLYGLVGNCTELSILMYGTFPYGCTDLSVHCTDRFFWKSEICFSFRKMCRFSKNVQKLSSRKLCKNFVFGLHSSW